MPQPDYRLAQATHWACCQCDNYYSYELYRACVRPGCQHRRCGVCRPCLSRIGKTPGPRNREAIPIRQLSTTVSHRETRLKASATSNRIDVQEVHGDFSVPRANAGQEASPPATIPETQSSLLDLESTPIADSKVRSKPQRTTLPLLTKHSIASTKGNVASKAVQEDTIVRKSVIVMPFMLSTYLQSTADPFNICISHHKDLSATRPSIKDAISKAVVSLVAESPNTIPTQTQIPSTLRSKDKETQVFTITAEAFSQGLAKLSIEDDRQNAAKEDSTYSWAGKHRYISSSLASHTDASTRTTVLRELDSVSSIASLVDQPIVPRILVKPLRRDGLTLSSQHKAEDLHEILYQIYSILLYFRSCHPNLVSPGDTSDGTHGHNATSHNNANSHGHKRQRLLSAGLVRDDKKESLPEDSESDTGLRGKKQKTTPTEVHSIPRPLACPFYKFRSLVYHGCSATNSVRIHSIQRHVIETCHSDYLDAYPHKSEQIKHIKKSTNKERWVALYMILFDVPADQESAVPDPYFVDPGACYQLPSPGDALHDIVARAMQRASASPLEAVEQASRLEYLRQGRDQLWKILNQSIVRRHRAEQDEIISAAQIRAGLAAEEQEEINRVQQLESQILSGMGWEVNEIGSGVAYPLAIEPLSAEIASSHQLDYPRPNYQPPLQQESHLSDPRLLGTAATACRKETEHTEEDVRRGFRPFSAPSWPAQTPSDSGYWSTLEDLSFQSPSSSYQQDRRLRQHNSPLNGMSSPQHPFPPTHVEFLHGLSPIRISDSFPGIDFTLSPRNLPSTRQTPFQSPQQTDFNRVDPVALQEPPTENDFNFLEQENDTDPLSSQFTPSVPTPTPTASRQRPPSGWKDPPRESDRVGPECRTCESRVTTAGETCNACDDGGFANLASLNDDFGEP